MPAARKTLVIRADADPRMGTGHVMRCLALAQAWRDAGGEVHVAAAAITPALEARLKSEGITPIRLQRPAGSLDDAEETARTARQSGAEWIVVDGYQFDADYQRAIRAAGFRLLVIDDHGHADSYAADLVLNQNLHAEESFYRNRDRSTRLLLGPRYVLVRREFWPWSGWRREIPEVAERLLVTLGGSDPDNATHKVVEAIAGIDLAGLKTTVLLGGSNPHRVEVEEAVRRAGPFIQVEIDATDMPRWMTWADAAIAAAGTTLWELALLAVPSLTLVLAENQEPAARLLAKRDVFPTLGWASHVSVDALGQQLGQFLLGREQREQSSKAAAGLVDGRGVFRVLEAMEPGQGSRGGRRESADD